MCASHRHRLCPCVSVSVCVCLGLASFRSFAVASARSLRLFRIPGPTRNSSISEPLKLDTGGSIKKRIGGSKTSTTLSERLREAIGCSGLEVCFAGGKTLNPKVVKVATSETHESVPALSECACRNPKNSKPRAWGWKLDWRKMFNFASLLLRSFFYDHSLLLWVL